MAKRPRRTINFEWHSDHERPLRIIRDPWEDGEPKTTISLTQYEAELLASFLNIHID